MVNKMDALIDLNRVIEAQNGGVNVTIKTVNENKHVCGLRIDKNAVSYTDENLFIHRHCFKQP